MRNGKNGGGGRWGGGNNSAIIFMNIIVKTIIPSNMRKAQQHLDAS